MENLMREITTENLSRAIKKARKKKPLVRAIAPTFFKVRSTRYADIFYSVEIIRANGKVLGRCSCEGFDKGNCIHICAAVSVSQFNRKVTNISDFRKAA